MKIKNKAVRRILNIKTREEMVQGAITNIISSITGTSSDFTQAEQVQIVIGIKHTYLQILDSQLEEARKAQNYIEMIKNEG